MDANSTTPGTPEYTAGLVEWGWGPDAPQDKPTRIFWYQCRNIHLDRVPPTQLPQVRSALPSLNHPQIIDQTAQLAGAAAAFVSMYLYPFLIRTADTALFSVLPIGVMVGLGVWWVLRDLLWNRWVRALAKLDITPPVRPQAFRFKFRSRRKRGPK